MHRSCRFLSLIAAALLLSACDENGDNGDDAGEIAQPPAAPPVEPPAPQRGDLIDGAPALVASYTPDALIGLVDAGELTELLLAEILTPECSIDVHHLKYQTVDPAGNITPASAALMVPNGPETFCQGERPIVMYAHGTATDRAFNIADLGNAENGEGLLMAAVFAAEGYIVVAPNYVGYDTSTLGYHPYLNAEQQSNDMIDALTAARSALPTANAPGTAAGARLLITGYSQGGFVAMATHRALQEAGEPVTASAPMSGPYALSAFGDAIFQGRVTLGAPVNLTLLLTSYENAYGDIYGATTDVYEAQYATGIDTLLPSTTPVGELQAQGLLPADALFNSTPPDPAYAALTPATTPAELAPVFALGFGTSPLLTNAFRLAYLQDAATNPDGGFPTLIDNQPPANPGHTFRVALKRNDLRNWTPTAPVLLCGGSGDPNVLYLNTELMQNFWGSTTTVTVLDIDLPVATDDPFEAQKSQFEVAKGLVELAGGDEAVFERYHAGLVAPFCLSAVKSFFDAQ